MAVIFLRIVVFLFGAFLSGGFSNLLGLYYIPLKAYNMLELFVGLIFGVVIVVWHVKSVREAISGRSAVLVLASTSIWGLVFLSVGELAKVWGNFFILYYGFAVLGTILLASAHALILDVTKRRSLIAIPLILGIWFLLINIYDLLPWHLRASGASIFNPGYLRYFSVPLAIWQGVYLLCMFGSIPRFPKGTNNGPPVGGLC